MPKPSKFPHPDPAPPEIGRVRNLLAIDPWLTPFADRLESRNLEFQAALKEMEPGGGLLGPISQGHLYFGLNRGENEGQPGVWYREWAPAAQSLALVGDFNGWSRDANPLTRDEWGTWSTFLPDREYGSRLVHGSRVKAHVVAGGTALDRVPAYIRRAVQDPETHDFSGQFWSPPQPYVFRNPSPVLPAGRSSGQSSGRSGLRIYEAHVGMAQEEARVGTFREFTDHVLSRARDGGYNAVQLMAVAEHPYYGSFGYHVSSFFAVSSRFGTPEELKELIDTAHGMGLRVFMDLVHSHAVKNVLEGLSHFDGTDHQYFHAGGRGEHPAWDSRLFDYSRYEVRRFLLSNVRYWLDEFRFDGFRFDGVTSMLYRDHGLGVTFSGYDDYFNENVDDEALLYLQLANQLVHDLRPDAVSIAEDVSGMAGMARPVEEGGLGFDYRLAMGVPDYWIKTLKERRDEDWPLGEIFGMLLNRRAGEKHVAYVESHDQALVGDKTLAFQLMDAEMYSAMSRHTQSLGVDRGIALHKLIRLLTFSLGGEAYLTFMGNEWGHPEWIDFPREGNGWSYSHARRQWSLADAEDLRFREMGAWDRAMLALDQDPGILEDSLIELLWRDDARKVLVYRRGPLVFACNFHAKESYSDLRIPVPDPVDYRPVLDSDATQFGGQGRTAAEVTYWRQDVAFEGRKQSIQLYLPSRTVQVLRPVT